jgi:ABC-2 type transport system permease protein
MIFPLDSIPVGIRWISYLLPLTYFIEIARGVLVRGAPFDALVGPLAALVVLAVLIFGLSVMRFRRDLSPASGVGLRARLARRSAATQA